MIKKIDWVLREILHRVYERNESFMSQKSLAQACGLSMDTVNRLVSKLNQFRAIEKKPFGFRVLDSKKVLLYWAATRNLARDVVYDTYSSDSELEIEAQMPKGTIFTAYSGYRRRFRTAPTDYDEVYVYADQDEVKRRFPASEVERRNVFVLAPDPHLKKVSRDGAAPLAQIYVDLWQVGGAVADKFIVELDKKLELAAAEALKKMIRATREGQGPKLLQPNISPICAIAHNHIKTFSRIFFGL